MRHNALIFDFDGTIADTLAEGINIYNQIARENGLKQVDRIQMHTLRSLDTAALLAELEIPKRKLPLLFAKGHLMLRSKMRSLKLIAGMEETLPKLRAHAEFFGILTSNSVENVETFLDSHGLHGLFTFISSTNKLTGKAKHLRAIGRTFSLREADMLYVGDEIRDIRAARKAHIDAVAVTWGLNSEAALAAENPRFLVNQPAELLKIWG